MVRECVNRLHDGRDGRNVDIGQEEAINLLLQTTTDMLLKLRRTGMVVDVGVRVR